MDLSQLTGHIWLDGEMVPWQEAKVHVLTHTFHYGLGVFEGVRAYNTSQGAAIFRLQEHTDRLFRSAKIMGMAMPFDKDVINDRSSTDKIKMHMIKSSDIRSKNPISLNAAGGNHQQIHSQ